MDRQPQAYFMSLLFTLIYVLIFKLFLRQEFKIRLKIANLNVLLLIGVFVFHAPVLIGISMTQQVEHGDKVMTF